MVLDGSDNALITPIDSLWDFNLRLKRRGIKSRCEDRRSERHDVTLELRVELVDGEVGVGVEAQRERQAELVVRVDVGEVVLEDSVAMGKVRGRIDAVVRAHPVGEDGLKLGFRGIGGCRSRRRDGRHQDKEHKRRQDHNSTHLVDRFMCVMWMKKEGEEGIIYIKVIKMVFSHRKTQ